MDSKRPVLVQVEKGRPGTSNRYQGGIWLRSDKVPSYRRIQEDES